MPRRMRAEFTSSNFGFLQVHDAQLVRLGALAERIFPGDDPTHDMPDQTSAVWRSAPLAQQVAARTGAFNSTEEPQADLLRRLKEDRIVSQAVIDLFHQVRITGEQSDLRSHGRPPRGADVAEGRPPAGHLVPPHLRRGTGRFRRDQLSRLLIHKPRPSSAKGSTHTTIYFPEIRALHICLAPLEEQREIVRRIERAFLKNRSPQS